MNTNHAKTSTTSMRALVLLVLLMGTTVAAPLPSLPGVTGAPYGAWRIDEVDVGYGQIMEDQQGSTFRSPLAVDSLGEPHLITNYVDEARGPFGAWVANHRYRVGAVWFEEELMESTDFDIAMGPDDEPRVVIHEGELNALKPLWYGTRTDAGWQFEQIVSVANALNPRLRFDASGAPHVAWRDGDRGMAYATKDASQGWVVESVEMYNQFVDLAVDSSGRAYLAYQEPFSGPTFRTIVAERLAPGVWSKQIVYACENTSWFSIDVDLSETLHLACAHTTLRYVPRVNGTWSSATTVSSTTWDGEDVALAVTPSGVPHLAYQSSAGALWHASLTPAGWFTERVDVIGPRVGSNAGIALDSLGTPRIAYEVAQGPLSFVDGGVTPDDYTLRYAEPLIGGALGVVVGVHPVLRGTLA